MFLQCALGKALMGCSVNHSDCCTDAGLHGSPHREHNSLWAKLTMATGEPSWQWDWRSTVKPNLLSVRNNRTETGCSKSQTPEETQDYFDESISYLNKEKGKGREGKKHRTPLIFTLSAELSDLSWKMCFLKHGSFFSEHMQTQQGVCCNATLVSSIIKLNCLACFWESECISLSHVLAASCICSHSHLGGWELLTNYSVLM